MAGIGADRQKLRILAHQPLAAVHAARGHRLADRDLRAAADEPLRNRAGDDGLSNAGVGAGDEEAGNGERVKHEYPENPLNSSFAWDHSSFETSTPTAS